MAPSYPSPSAETERMIVDEETLNCVLTALEDEDCRDILEVTVDATLTANELSEACSLPLSTTYRKVEKLTDADLLDEKVRLSTSGKHKSEYTHNVADISLSVDGEDGVSLLISLCEDADPATSILAGAD